MPAKLYNLTFNGQITGQFSQEIVIKNLAVLFKKDPQSMAKLFSGEKFTLSRGLTLEAAQKYQVLLKKAGAIVSLDEQGSGQKPASASAPQGKINIASGVSVAPAGSLITKSVRIEEPEIVISRLSMSEPGVTIVEHKTIPEPVINTDMISLSPSGSPLGDHQEQPVFDKKVGQYDLAPVGAIISKEKPANKSEIDISKLSMDTRNNQQKPG